MCEIGCWRGYVTWQFFVESSCRSRAVARLAVLPSARSRERRSSRRRLSRRMRALVEALVAAGWEPEGYGEEWFAERFQRPIP